MATMDWQTQCKSQRDCFKFLLKNEEMSDVVFVVGEEKSRLPAHSFLLAARSPVFKAMFYGEMKESSRTNNNHEVEVPDIDAEAFIEMLCAPKSSIENLRSGGHCRSFCVMDYGECEGHT